MKADKFEYHCVLNENVTGLVEVCAPYKHVFGQRNFFFAVKDVLSIFKYQRLYNISSV